MQVLGNRILLKQDREKLSTDGFEIPEEFKEKSLEAKVVSIGDGYMGPHVEQWKFRVQPGDTVIIPKYDTQYITIKGEKFILLSEAEIIAIIK